MLQTVVFVDAGYLHAQGSALIVGSSQRRERNTLNLPLLLADLIEEARIVEPAARLLRIYWYDGIARGAVLNPEQTTLAKSENVKCRFGVINSKGQQKGVDSLIVTDLIQLAREHACSDAVILSGDEDLRVGVQIAQTFGIRVHVLGIHPARGSQSSDLLAEADTTREWGREKVAAWLTVAPTPPIIADADQAAPPASSAGDTLNDHAITLVTSLEDDEAARILDHVQRNQGLPSDFDRPALASARDMIKRSLVPDERSAFRDAIRTALRERDKKRNS